MAETEPRSVWRRLWAFILYARGRDLAFIFIGLFGIVVLGAIVSNKIESNRVKRELVAKQAQEEHERQEAQQEALAEQRRQQALREQQLAEERERRRKAEERRAAEEAERAKELREEAERRRAEEGERKKREEAEQQRLAQLSELRQLGVRSVPIHAVNSDPFQNLGAWLKVSSEPEGADVYLNWAHKGKTPLWLSGTEIAGFLLITKEDHAAWFRDIAHHENGVLAASLTANMPHPRTRLLLALAEDAPNNAFSFLRSRLSDAGFLIPEAGAAEEFRRTERTAGGLASHAFRAWARTKFSTDLVLRARVHERNRGIDVQSPALTGTIRVFVDLDFDLYDLTTGQQLALVTAAKSTFTLDHTQGFQEALEAATEDALPKLRRELER